MMATSPSSSAVSAAADVWISRSGEPSNSRRFPTSDWTDDFQRLHDKALSLGYKVIQEVSIGGEQGRFAYLDTEHDQ
jgi:hypothetical protein